MAELCLKINENQCFCLVGVLVSAALFIDCERLRVEGTLASGISRRPIGMLISEMMHSGKEKNSI